MTRLAGPVFVAAALVLSAPFVGELRAWLRASFGGAFVPAANVAIGIAATGVALVALARIRDRRLLRYTLLAAAVGVAVVFGGGAPGASAETRAVERFHFVEYGLIAWLFYRACGPQDSAPGGRGSRREDAGPLVLALIAGLLVGTADEAFQWFIPGRYGELRDIFLNLASLGFGLLVAVGVAPPASMTWRLTAASRRRAGIAGAWLILSLCGFTHLVHLGHEIRDADLVFRSRDTRAALGVHAAARAERWRLAPPPASPPRFSREDQFLTEGLWHVQARNARWDTGEFSAAWGENQILETYFAPVLALGHAWPPEQRVDAARRAQGIRGPYVSHAERLPIFTWPAWVVWVVGTAAALGALGVTRNILRRGRVRAGS